MTARKPASTGTIEGRKLTDKSHERAVAEFLADVEATNPSRLAEVLEKYPVVTETRLTRIREREVPAFSPSDEADSAELMSNGASTSDDFISVSATYEAALGRPLGYTY